MMTKETLTIEAKPAHRRIRHSVVRTGALTGKVFDQQMTSQLKAQAMTDGQEAGKDPEACHPRCMDPTCDKCQPPAEFTGNMVIENSWFIGYDQASRRFPSIEEVEKEGREAAIRDAYERMMAGKPVLLPGQVPAPEPLGDV